VPDKYEAPGWVNAWAALRTVSDRLSLFVGPGGADDTAYSVLSNAIIRGDIAARDAPGGLLRKAEHWKAVDSDSGLPLRDIEVQRLGLDTWLESNDPVPIADAKRGVRASYDWDKAWAATCLYIHENGLPEVQADLERVMLRWFSETYGQEPSESLIKQKVKVLFETFRKASN
jgi:hypothetical protein